MAKKLKVLAIIQARMGSKRFPSKIMAELCEMPMIEVLVRRLQRAKLLDQIVVATTTESSDDVLCKWLKNNNLEYFRGSENDVLDRFYRCAKVYQPNVIVRITADDPLKDPEIIDQAISDFLSFVDVDYYSNTLQPTFPEGLDIELFTFEALQRAHECAALSSEREHVTPYIWKHPEKFSIKGFEMEQDLSHWRWTVDKPVDLIFIQSVMGVLNNDIYASYRNVIDVINNHPELSTINTGTVRNEGYINSLASENSSE